MAILEFAGGLSGHKGFRRKKIAMFFDDAYGLIEAPTKWMVSSVAKRGSRSEKTSDSYARILHRYLDWLDNHIPEGFDAPLGAHNWSAVHPEVFDEYLLEISQPDPAVSSLPSKNTLLHYAYRIWDFYNWAEAYGYTHYLEIDNRQVERRLEHQLMRLHSRPNKTVTKARFNLPVRSTALYAKEVEKFVSQRDYEAALELLDDPVYQVIAVVIRIVGLRPCDLLHQLPYRGTGTNSGFVPYDRNSIPTELDGKSISYYFKSKGKHRTVSFPGRLWAVICDYFIPLRRERAKLYMNRHGYEPPNSELFLNAEGKPVTYRMLHYNFAKVVKNANNQKTPPGGSRFRGRQFNARMLRHTCATYFVYEALTLKNRLGSNYVYDAALDEALRKMLGHEDVGTTLQYYVHLVNRFVRDDLLGEIHAAGVDAGLSAIIDKHDYHAPRKPTSERP